MDDKMNIETGLNNNNSQEKNDEKEGQEEF